MAFPFVSPKPVVIKQSSSTTEDIRTGSTAKQAKSSTSSQSPSDLWSRLYTEDPAKLAGNLRAAGFPPIEVRAIFDSLFFQKFDAARAKILGRREDVPYWKEVSFMSDNPEQRAKLMELNDEESKTLRKLFARSEEILNDPEYAAYARRRFGDFPLQKLQSISKIEDDYSELAQEIYHQLSTGRARELTATDREKLALLETEKRRDLQQALTPEEFNNYELHNSPTASRLRSQLQIFRPTETEYRAIFALQQSVDEQFSTGVTDERRTAYSAAMDQLKPQIQTLLGLERYADYVQATENGSDKLNRLMARLDLPLSTAGKITEVRQDITQRADTIRNDQSLAATERDTQLAALAQEARTKLTTTLGGERGYQAYDDMKGDWVRALQTKTAAAKP